MLVNHSLINKCQNRNMKFLESRKEILVRGLKVLCLVLALASAFVGGVLYARRPEALNFVDPKPRPKAIVTVGAGGVSAMKSQDFTMYAKDGLKIEGEKVTVSGFGGPVSVFNDSLEVELNFEKGFGVASSVESCQASGGGSSSSGESKSSDTPTSGRIVASKSGTKYYFESCSEVNRIKKENLVYFSSEAEAKANGYEASSCVLKTK